MAMPKKPVIGLFSIHHGPSNHARPNEALEAHKTISDQRFRRACSAAANRQCPRKAHLSLGVTHTRAPGKSPGM